MQQENKKFEDIYKEYYSKVYNYLFYRLNNKETTEDLASEVFIKVMSKYNTYDPQKAKIFTWILKITKNTLIDHYRKNAKWIFKDETSNSGEDKSIFIENELDNKIQAEEQIECIIKAMNNASKVDKTILSMRYFNHMSYKEIFDITGYSVKHIGVILSRALKRLKKQINDYEIFNVP